MKQATPKRHSLTYSSRSSLGSWDEFPAAFPLAAPPALGFEALFEFEFEFREGSRPVIGVLNTFA